MFVGGIPLQNGSEISGNKSPFRDVMLAYRITSSRMLKNSAYTVFGISGYWMNQA
jgi:hypothetical protein